VRRKVHNIFLPIAFHDDLGRRTFHKGNTQIWRGYGIRAGGSLARCKLAAGDGASENGVSKPAHGIITGH
jgi:hypothetical protein